MTIKVSEALVTHLSGDYYVMVSDESLEELNQFARKLKIGFAYHNNPHQPHYTLSPSKRIKALRLGAKLATPEEIVEVWRKNQ